jgi:very-short-patch-repair endonuclease
MPLYYHSELRANARTLRRHMTEAEQCIWRCLRRKQLLNVQFYRQRPIGCYVVDFYAPSIKLVIEIDGSQHFEESHIKYDENRRLFLEKQGLKVLRFNNFDVLKNTRDVLNHVFQVMQQVMLNKIPPLV